MAYLIKPCQKIRGVVDLPGDKSISHRAIIISAIAEGKNLIKNFGFSDDSIATLNAIRLLGVKVEQKDKSLIINGVGLFGLKKPKKTLNLGESGTSIRILLGLLCAQDFKTELDGKKSLRKRPMLRVIQPLRLMGAKIKAKIKGQDEYPPISISSSVLKPISWKMSIASAQIKSAIMLAGLYAEGITKIYEPVKSRDHTERMLRYFGARLTNDGRWIFIKPSDLISPKTIYIPSDISSAAFFMVLACILKGSFIRIKNVCLNPTRCGVIRVLKKMGACIKIVYKDKRYFESMGDVLIRSSKLKAIEVTEKDIPELIDELPILMVAASFAKGKSIFRGVEELRVKETDRIMSMAKNLSRMGVNIETKLKQNKEVIVIKGAKKLKGATLNSFGDHRTAISMIIAGLCADSPSKIDDIKCISKSFPDFIKILRRLTVY